MPESKRQPLVVILAGGTGGHVYPALAVAKELQALGSEVLWVGTKHGIEAKVVPANGIALTTIRAYGLRRRGLLAYLLMPYWLSMSLISMLLFLRQHKPKAVLGMGGYATVAGCLAAYLLNIPLFIHEQNAAPGLSNRLLAYLAKGVMLGFPDSMPSPKAQYTGNPVRSDFCGLPKPILRWQGRKKLTRLLIIGGSQGASIFNNIVPAALAQLNWQDLQVRQQTGRGKLQEAQMAYQQAQVQAELFEFADDLAQLYAWADIVISRAGASSVAEITAVGSAAILVPYPYAVDNHQFANAHCLSKRQAAILIEQTNMTAKHLADTLKRYQHSMGDLLNIARRAQDLSPCRSAHRVAQTCYQGAMA